MREDTEAVWKVVKDTRMLFLTMFNNETESSNGNPSLASDYHIQNNFEKVSSELNITVAYKHNVTDETLQTAMEMFTYMNYFPPKLILLYKKLFKYESPKKILLAMTNLLKSSDSLSREISNKIWLKMRKYLPPLYSQYDDWSFEHCTPNKGEFNDTICESYRKTIGS